MLEHPVIFEERTTKSSHKLAIATLNRPASLNALSVEMITLLQRQLDIWQNDPAVVCVWLQGAGSRAFCAGGDVVSLYQASAAYGEDLHGSDVAHFFTEEYRLDYQLHTYPKPLIIWGSGVVMGGGVGLLSGGDHRIVTETTRIAMPEVTIGLYPDVGASWFLNRMPGKAGLFLGMTGASLGASDALYLGLADRFIPEEQKDVVFDTLMQQEWQPLSSENQRLINVCLKSIASSSSGRQPEGQIHQHMDIINQWCDAGSVVEIVNNIQQYTGEDAWLIKARDNLSAGCPVTPFIVAEQIKRGKYLSLADVFRMELSLSVRCAASGNLREGVRALLIDKDRKPQWQPSTVSLVTPEIVNSYFEPCWEPQQHPLADLVLYTENTLLGDY